jgi:hypothetical protein
MPDYQSIVDENKLIPSILCMEIMDRKVGLRRAIFIADATAIDEMVTHGIHNGARDGVSWIFGITREIWRSNLTALREIARNGWVALTTSVRAYGESKRQSRGGNANARQLHY